VRQLTRPVPIPAGGDNGVVLNHGEHAGRNVAQPGLDRVGRGNEIQQLLHPRVGDCQQLCSTIDLASHLTEEQGSWPKNFTRRRPVRAWKTSRSSARGPGRDKRRRKLVWRHNEACVTNGHDAGPTRRSDGNLRRDNYTHLAGYESVGNAGDRGPPGARTAYQVNRRLHVPIIAAPVRGRIVAVTVPLSGS
jgi:hypothetical protein